MIIEVNCNTDEVIINETIKYPCKNPTQIIKILEEIFHIQYRNKAFEKGGLNISLIKIDEDTRTTIGEW